MADTTTVETAAKAASNTTANADDATTAKETANTASTSSKENTTVNNSDAASNSVTSENSAKNDGATTAKADSGAAFTKDQLIASKKYADYVDIISAVFSDGRTYTSAEASSIISSFLGRTVN